MELSRWYDELSTAEAAMRFFVEHWSGLGEECMQNMQDLRDRGRPFLRRSFGDPSFFFGKIEIVAVAVGK